MAAIPWHCCANHCRSSDLSPPALCDALVTQSALPDQASVEKHGLPHPTAASWEPFHLFVPVIIKESLVRMFTQFTKKQIADQFDGLGCCTEWCMS